jgi:DNA polymerase-1
MDKVLVVHDDTPSDFSKGIVDTLVNAHGCSATHVTAEDYFDKKMPSCTKVLCVGAQATKSVFHYPNQVKMTLWRGRSLEAAGRYTVCTWYPSIVTKGQDARDFFREIEFDIRKLCTHSSPVPEKDTEVHVLEYKKDLTQLRDLQASSFISCDIETTGFNPVTAEILSIGFCALNPDDSGYVLIVPQHLLLEPVSRFFSTYKGTTIFHNLKFDVKHIWKKFGRFEFAATDTMLLNYVLDERPFNRFKAHSLKLLARLYFDAPDYDIDMGRFIEDYLNPEVSTETKKEMLEEMYLYQAYDCHYTARLYKELLPEAEDESTHLLSYLEHTLIPASFAISQMEITGAPVDIPYLQTMKTEIEHLMELEMKEIRRLVKRHTDREDPSNFNPNSSKQVSEVLYNAGDEGGLGLAMPKGVGRFAYKRAENAVTTNADTLKVLARQVAKEIPAAAKLINLIMAYRVKSKILGTYVDGLLSRVDSDGRIRGDFNLHGTATGRLSCSNPNLQNIPDASHVGFDIRRAYIPSPKWVMVEADYSQLELRVAALFSQDPVLLEAYRNDADIHQEVAQMLWDKPKEEISKYERYLAKCMNFGVIYGRGAKSIATGVEMDNLIEMSGRKWSEKEIDAYFAKFKVGYGALFEWMDLMKEYFFKLKYVEGPLGNRRRFPCVLNGDAAATKRQIVNSPIQGFAAQMTVRAVVELDRLFNPKTQQLLMTVHDSIQVQCVNKPKVIRDTADTIRDVMEKHLPFDSVCTFPTLDHSPFTIGEPLVWNLPFKADISYGPSWAECKYDPWDIESALADRSSADALSAK